MNIDPISARWLQQRLLRWYHTHGRKTLPWKKPLSPYRVWISEIMLQQTQVSTVTGYFKQFIRAFPTVEKLAQAPLEAVLSHWAGLGYYARARNIHKTAKIIQQDYANQLPACLETLTSFPGIGRSTAGAILSMGFNLSAPILDGNVKRVLCRLHCVEGPPDDRAVQTTLWQLAEHYTPKQNAADFTQAIMDLGATCCTKANPSCQLCPLQTKCEAFSRGEQLDYPHKKASKKIPHRETHLLYVSTQNEILLQQRPQKGIWGGLYSLPEFGDTEEIQQFLENILKTKRGIKPLTPVKHTFTHFHLLLKPYALTLAKTTTLDHLALHWIKKSALAKIGLPAPIKKLLE